MRFSPALSLVMTLVSLSVSAQEAGYNDDYVTPSRVPSAFRATAEKEAPGIRFTKVLRDNEKAYRFVGRDSVGKTVSVKVGSGGKLEFRKTYADVAPAKLPRPVSAAIKAELARDPQFSGFAPARTSLVESYDARTSQNATYYEVFGHTPGNVHPRIEVEASGRVRTVDVGFIPNIEDNTTRTPLTARDTPPSILQGVNQAVPNIKIARLFQVTDRTSPELVEYEAYGWADRDRAAEIRMFANGMATTIAVTFPVREIPPAVLAAVRRESANDGKLKGFQPLEARRVRVPALNEEQIQLFGDGPDGDPLSVKIKPDGSVDVMGDSGEIVREEAGTSTIDGSKRREVIPSKGFHVVAARYGVYNNWIDATSYIREAAEAGRDAYVVTEKIPDPAVGHAKNTVMLFTINGRVGLAQAREDKPLPLGEKAEFENLSAIPDEDFAVVAALFGREDKWQDVTEEVAAKISRGRLDFRPEFAKLTDPAIGQHKALAVAYVDRGRLGLSTLSERHWTELPYEAGPINSGPLVARSLEFAKPPSLAAFTPDGRSVVVGVEDGTIRVIEVATGRELRRFEGHGPGWIPVAVGGNSGLIVSGGPDKTVRLWDLKAGREKAVLRGHTDNVHRVTASPNGRVVASTSWDKTVRIWDAATGRELRAITGHRDFVNGIAFSPDGRRLLTAGWDRCLRVHDVASGREQRQHQTDGDALGDAAFSRSGKEVIFGAKDGVVREWAYDSDQPPRSIVTHVEAENGVTPLLDPQLILVGDWNAATVWNLRSGHPVLRLGQHANKITGLAVSPDGKTAATCSMDRTLKLWSLTPVAR